MKTLLSVVEWLGLALVGIAVVFMVLVVVGRTHPTRPPATGRARLLQGFGVAWLGFIGVTLALNVGIEGWTDGWRAAARMGVNTGTWTVAIAAATPGILALYLADRASRS